MKVCIDSPTNMQFIFVSFPITMNTCSGSPIGKTNQAGIKDIIIESAITAICDLEVCAFICVVY